MDAARIKALNRCEIRKGSFVVYWMQASQRVEFNHVLLFAIEKANGLKLPLFVFFCLVDDYPSANYRHYKFMLEGLAELSKKLAELGIGFHAFKHPSPPEAFAKFAEGGAALAVVDRGYTRIQKKWRDEAARLIKCPLFQIESDVVVPVEMASCKEEYSAATFRPKMRRLLDRFMGEKFSMPKIEVRDARINPTMTDRLDISSPGKVLSGLKIDRSVSSAEFAGGYGNAKKLLRAFISDKLPLYAEFARDPGRNVLSGLSPYLHFGQISSLEVAQEVSRGGFRCDEFLDELIVRRELAVNFVNFNKDYDNYSCIPAWAGDSLAKHAKDRREYIYSLDRLENADTHDRYWNGCQKEMLRTGKMHGYMRMYWGKKVVEWTKSPEEAFEILLRLNDRHELDGRDPNGYAGVAWCFGKHDRPWTERMIFGKIRYMNAAGLERKFNMDEYFRRLSPTRRER